jgi:hypothetical protein
MEGELIVFVGVVKVGMILEEGEMTKAQEEDA